MRWSAYQRRITEYVVYHGHEGVAYPAYHTSYNDKAERLYECSKCGKEITEAQATETDERS
jgi:hypothetical protein